VTGVLGLPVGFPANPADRNSGATDPQVLSGTPASQRLRTRTDVSGSLNGAIPIRPHGMHA